MFGLVSNTFTLFCNPSWECLWSCSSCLPIKHTPPSLHRPHLLFVSWNVTLLYLVKRICAIRVLYLELVWQSTMFSRFIHIVAGVRILPFLRLKHIPYYEPHTLFTHSSTDGRLGCSCPSTQLWNRLPCKIKDKLFVMILASTPQPNPSNFRAGDDGKKANGLHLISIAAVFHFLLLVLKLFSSCLEKVYHLVFPSAVWQGELKKKHHEKSPSVHPNRSLFKEPSETSIETFSYQFF